MPAQQKAVFTFGLSPGDGILRAASARGQTDAMNGIRLWSKEPGDTPFAEPKPEQGAIKIGNTVLAYVSVVNETGDIIRNVQARVASISDPNWANNDTVWDYGPVNTGAPPANESTMLRWLFHWTGGGAVEHATLQIAVTWNAGGSMPAPASDFSLPIGIEMGTSTDTIICCTEAGATDLFDLGRDTPRPPPPPSPSWVQGLFWHPEWAAQLGAVELTDFAIDSRATLLSGGQSKTWDFVVQSSASSSESVIMRWDTSALPPGLSAQMIDVEGRGGTPMATLTSPFTFTHPGSLAKVPFQIVVSAA